jgi:hypothetical protein
VDDRGLSRTLSGQFSAPENSRKICARAAFPPLCMENLMFPAMPRRLFSLIQEVLMDGGAQPAIQISS